MNVDIGQIVERIGIGWIKHNGPIQGNFSVLILAQFPKHRAQAAVHLGGIWIQGDALTKPFHGLDIAILGGKKIGKVDVGCGLFGMAFDGLQIQGLSLVMFAAKLQQIPQI